MKRSIDGELGFDPSTPRQLTTLQHQGGQLLKRLYGRKFEKRNHDQFMFDPHGARFHVAAVGTTVGTEVRRTRRAVRCHPWRLPIPDHLDRVVFPAAKRSALEVLEKLKCRPQRLIINVYERPQ